MRRDAHPSVRPGWRAVGASVAGASHVRAGQPCQDSQRCRSIPIPGWLPPDTLIAAVADGAGSARYGGEGSALAVDAATSQAAAMLLDCSNGISPAYLKRIMLQSMRAAYSQIANTAWEKRRSIRQYDTTLLLAVSVDGTLATAQVGDGAVVAGNSWGGYSCITVPERGEYANQTNFITGRGAVASAQYRVAENCNPQRLAMFTDGLQNLALEHPANAPFPGFFTPFFNWLATQTDELAAYAGLRAFLQSDRVTALTGDDTTLLLALREQR